MAFLLEPLDREKLQQVAEAVDGAAAVVAQGPIDDADPLVIPHPSRIRRLRNPAIARADVEAPEKPRGGCDEFLERQLGASVTVERGGFSCHGGSI